MTRHEAIAYVSGCAEDDGPDTYEYAAEIFEALYDRAPDDDDGDLGAVWSLCCAAVPDDWEPGDSGNEMSSDPADAPGAWFSPEFGWQREDGKRK